MGAPTHRPVTPTMLWGRLPGGADGSAGRERNYDVSMSQEPFGDVPLFREIQKLLASGGGPINFEIARQVGLATATQGSADPNPQPDVQRSFDDATHAAEGLLVGYTRRQLDEPVLGKVVGRAWWVQDSLKSWKWLLERLATRLTGELGGLGRGEESETSAMTSALGQVVPLLLGIQMGTLVGHLATESLGRYDWPIPRDDDTQLFYVTPNVDKLASDYGFEIETFRRWVAVRDTARHLVVTTVPWFDRYLRSLLSEVVDAMEIDTADLERRLMELQTKGPEALQESFGDGGALPIAPTERHRKALDRLRALLAAFEGYAGHAARAIMPEIAGDTTRIDEGMTRAAMSPSQSEKMLSSFLGIALDRELETSGSTYCAAIAQLKGVPALNSLWAAPDNLPLIEEIKDPFTWMERVLGE